MEAEEDTLLTVPKRTQPRRRLKTRANIVEAARQVFSRTTYIQATIDDIIVEAGISRATLYQYFESKAALAMAIYDEISPEIDALMAALPELSGKDASRFEAWLWQFVDLYRRHSGVVPLLAQLQLFEERYRLKIREDIESHLGILSRGGVGNLDPNVDDEAVVTQRVRARHLLLRIATICGDIAAGNLLSPAEVDASIALAVAELRLFLNENAS